MRYLLFLFLIPQIVFADDRIVARLVNSNDVAVFHDRATAERFRIDNHGEIYISYDDGTFIVVYPIKIAVSNIPDDVQPD